MKKSKLEMERLSYYEMSLILSYCDADTQVNLLGIEDSFIWISNILALKANLESLAAYLRETPDHDQIVLASWEEQGYDQADKLVSLCREVEEDASQIEVDSIYYPSFIGNKRWHEVVHVLQMFVEPQASPTHTPFIDVKV